MRDSWPFQLHDHLQEVRKEDQNIEARLKRAIEETEVRGKQIKVNIQYSETPVNRTHSIAISSLYGTWPVLTNLLISI